MKFFDTFNEKGKCCDCEENKPLDELIAKNMARTQYHCNDCRTIIEWEEYNKISMSANLPDDKVSKLLRWCFG